MDIIPPRAAEEGPVYVPANFSTTVEILKVAVSLNCILVAFNLTRYYRQLLNLGIIRTVLLPQDNFYSAGLLGDYCTELFLVLIHPIPGFDLQIDITEVVRYS